MPISSVPCLLRLSFGVLLAGCASGPPKGGALVPVDTCNVASTRVNVLAATTRVPDPGGEMFSGERALPDVVGHARIVVSIPPSHVPGAIEWPAKAPGDPARNFATAERTYLDAKGFRADLDEALAARKPRDRDVLLFVHGYNTSFDEAVYRLAQFTLDSAYKGVPVSFSLPSRAETLGYVYDRDSTILSRDALEATLRGLLADANVHKVNILAHSMGALLLMETLRQIEIAGDRALTSRIGEIVLAAPDIDVQLFRYQVSRLGGRMPVPTTIFVSGDDLALSLSSKLAGGMPRLGEYVGATEFSSAGITVVDLSAASAGAGDPMNHEKVFANGGLALLVGAQFNQGYGFGDNPPEAGDRIAWKLDRISGSFGEVLGAIAPLPASKRR